MSEHTGPGVQLCELNQREGLVDYKIFLFIEGDLKEEEVASVQSLSIGPVASFSRTSTQPIGHAYKGIKR